MWETQKCNSELVFGSGPSLTVETQLKYDNYNGVHFYDTVITIAPYFITIAP